MPHEGGLHGVRGLRRAQAFDGGHGGALVHHGQAQAGHHPPAIDQHRAGPALAMVAAFLGAGQVQVLAQGVEQRGAGVQVQAVFLAVHLQGDGQLDPFGDGGRLHLRAGRSRHGRCRSRGGTCNQQVPARNGKLGVVFHGASIVLALRGACTLLRTRHSKHRFGTRPGL